MDLIDEVVLPSKGLVYDKEIKWSNRLRAPRLCDRGIGDLTKKNKLQASILDKTLLEPLGMSAYDLHTADFLYLNFMQRQIAKAGQPYKIKVKCENCRSEQIIDFDLKNLKVNYLSERPEYIFKTLNGEEIEYTFLTPRKIDDAKEASELYKEEFPGAEQDVELQELLRSVILKVDGVKPTHSQMTDFINNMYTEDSDRFIEKLMDINFGLDLHQSVRCPKCGKTIKFILPV
jgi:ribosomal protein S27E